MQLFSEGKRLVEEERQQDYGDPRRLWGIVAELWGVIFRHFGVTVFTCMAAMVLVKLVRELIKPKQDNRDDIAGYTYMMGNAAKEANADHDQ